MGLDGVEIVMEVEDRFGVQLPDSECARVRTVADLAALVISRLPSPSGSCPTARAFFTLRDVMTDHAGVERRRLRPSARLTDLFPSGLRRRWRALRMHEPRLPRLVATPAVDTAMLWATAIGLFAGVAAVGVAWTTLGMAAGVFAFLLVIVGMMMIGRTYAEIGWHLPPGVETLGDVVRAVAPIEVSRGDSPGRRLLAQQQVLDEVRRITSEQLGLPLEHVRPEADFVKDLDLL